MNDYPDMSAADEEGNRVLFLYDPENPSNKNADKRILFAISEAIISRVFKKVNWIPNVIIYVISPCM